MASDGVMPISLKLQTEKRAAPGKFRVLVLIDSEMYQLGEDQDTLETALDIYEQHGKSHPFQVYDDQGKGQTRQFD
jgi:hypothetical protein